MSSTDSSLPLSGSSSYPVLDTTTLASMQALETMAGSLLQSGRFSDAEGIYRQLIDRGSKNHIVFCNLGSILLSQDRTVEAIPWLEAALVLEPDAVGAHVALGVAFQTTGDLQSAIAAYTRALRLEPSLDDIRLNLGVAYRQSGDFAKASSCFSNLLARHPSDSNLHLQMGLVQLQMAAPEAAIGCFNTALRLTPNNQDALHHLAQAWQQQGDLDTAVVFYRKALALQPDDPFMHNNLGTALQRQGCLAGAIAAYHQAIALDANQPAAHGNLGVALHQQGDFDAAVASFRQALRLLPADPEARFNLATTLLLTGDYEAGWQHFEARSERHLQASLPHATPNCPRWDGSPLEPDTPIVLVSEQGLGDTLQFMRYAPMLKQLGTRVSLCAQPQLEGLISASEISDAYVTSEQATCIKEGYWIPLLSLPQLLGVSAAEPRVSTPYIKTTETHLGRWRNLLAAEHRPIIAIHWQGNPSAEQTVLRGRSFPLEAFAPLAAIDEIVLLSLQKGAGSEQLPVCSFRDRFVQSQSTIDSTWDLLDAAAIIANCDLVITNDTAVAHLAGGMGQRTWLLLQSIPDWRWGLRGNSCLWYPSLRLFRQPKAGQWDVVMQEVAETLRHLLATGMRQ